ncbi:MAG: PQQ-dependent sugar dehydrogenase, partial [Actinomycetota bacterium]
MSARGRALRAGALGLGVAGLLALPTGPAPSAAAVDQPCATMGTAALEIPAVDAPPLVLAAGDRAVGLRAPWGLVSLADGSTLVSERDSGRIVRIDSSGTVRTLTRIAESAPAGEGGLLGIAIDPTATWVYAYVTTATDNRVVRLALDEPDGAREESLTGIPKADIHNGGRIAFGPDGNLYVATGDAMVPESAQDPASPAGKILRIDATGGIPAGNPFAGSPVWSLGHRNVQGLAFDSHGRLWATEFGTDKADELNLIEAAGNYGWPIVEGAGGDPATYVDPKAQWSPTSLASPSGLAIQDDVAYVAYLRGKVLLQVPLRGAPAAVP